MKTKVWAIAAIIVAAVMIDRTGVRADGGSCDAERAELKAAVQQLAAENRMLRAKLSQIEAILGPGTPRPN